MLYLPLLKVNSILAQASLPPQSFQKHRSAFTKVLATISNTKQSTTRFMINLFSRIPEKCNFHTPSPTIVVLDFISVICRRFRHKTSAVTLNVCVTPPDVFKYPYPCIDSYVRHRIISYKWLISQVSVNINTRNLHEFQCHSADTLEKSHSTCMYFISAKIWETFLFHPLRLNNTRPRLCCDDIVSI